MTGCVGKFVKYIFSTIFSFAHAKYIITAYILIRKRNAKRTNMLVFFSFCITKIYFSDKNIDSPVKCDNHTFVAFPRTVYPIAIARGL